MNAAAVKERDRVASKTTPTFASAAAGALYQAIAGSIGTDALDQLARALWRGYGEGAIDDDDASLLQTIIERRRQLADGRRGIGGRAVGKIVSRFAPRQCRKLIDGQKQAARVRRRMLGSSADAPANIRCQYTEGERSTLFVIVGEVKHHGLCDLPIGKIAALAGVCRTTVQNALREARRLGHIKVTERPQPGRKNLTNIVHIVSAEWLAWIKRGPPAHRPSGIGSKNFLRRDNNSLSPTKNVNFKKRNGGKQHWRGSGQSESSWRGSGSPETRRGRRE